MFVTDITYKYLIHSIIIYNITVIDASLSNFIKLFKDKSLIFVLSLFSIKWVEDCILIRSYLHLTHTS